MIPSLLMKIRHLEKNDFHKSYFQLLKQLTIIDEDKITEEQFYTFVDYLDNNHYHKVFVMTQRSNVNQIIATATCFIEPKVIHNMGKVGHIEDVVCHADYRGQNIGKTLIDYIVDYCMNEHSCYKVILDCNEKNVGFYEKCGFNHNGTQMAIYQS